MLVLKKIKNSVYQSITELVQISFLLNIILEKTKPLSSDFFVYDMS